MTLNEVDCLFWTGARTFQSAATHVNPLGQFPSLSTRLAGRILLRTGKSTLRAGDFGSFSGTGTKRLPVRSAWRLTGLPGSAQSFPAYGKNDSVWRSGARIGPARG